MNRNGRGRAAARGTQTRRSWFCVKLLVLSGMLGVSPLQGDTFPTQERGFATGKSFQAGEMDNVNVFSGQLVLAFALSGSRPIGGPGGLSLGLSLVYNSAVWDFQGDSGVTQAYPSRRSNSGMGFQISLGRLIPEDDPSADCGADCYVAPDGSEHIFFDVLHYDDAEDPGDTAFPPVQNVRYSRDGTYFRLRKVGADRELDFPNGEVHKFRSDGRIVSIRDGAGSGDDIAITYQDIEGKYTITDRHGRTITVNLSGAAYYGTKVASVVVPVFGGSTTMYSFEYTEQSIPRACPHNDPTMSTSITVPLMTAIVLPDGSRFAMPLSDYHLDALTNCKLPGTLKGLTLPTLGRIDWDYGEYKFPTGVGEKPWRSTAMGVVSRVTRNPTGAELGTWTYEPSLEPPLPAKPLEAIRKITTPLGDRTDHYFSVGSESSGGGWTIREYGLPFSRAVPDGGGRFLSTRVHDCNPTCSAKRETYLAFEMDTAPLVLADDVQIDTSLNRRLANSRTNFLDDGGRFAATASSGFDGLGHYRTTVLSGNFGAGDDRTMFTNFNATRGAYPGGTFDKLEPTEPWVLNTFTETTATEGAVTQRQQFCFNATSGFLERQRTLKTTFLGANDLLATFAATSNGDLEYERYFGGDVAPSLNVTPANLCNLTVPTNAQAQFTLKHRTDFGTRALTQNLDSAGVALPFNVLDQTIDLGTGLVSSSRDVALVSTAFEYDEMGRIKWVKPVSDTWIEHVYTPATGSTDTTVARIDIKRRPNGSANGTPKTEQVRRFDSLGRLWRDEQKMPTGPFSVRETLYNDMGQDMGQVASVSELGNTAKKTEFRDYDAFGRATVIRPPDGSTHDVTLSYTGTRSLARTVQVGTAVNTESAATTTELYDRQGRLWQVTEPSGAGGTNTTTVYSYDVGGRLSQTSTTSGATTQVRTFSYDNLGFLRFENHPEKTANSLGLGHDVDYPTYDAMGHALRTVDGTSDLTYLYDAAARLTTVKETAGAQRTLKLFSYATDNGAGGDKRLGKLRTATRTQYFSVCGAPHNASVEETYFYLNSQGRTSKRDTKLSFDNVVGESFTQSFTWDSLGLPDTVTYPDCSVAAACGPSVPRTVDFNHDQGRLTEVVGYASSIAYHGNGAVNLVTHTNGVVDTVLRDSNWMPRPRQIKSDLGATPLWDSGTYSFDGAGNITKTGSGNFVYDKVSRLVQGDAQMSAIAGSYSAQSYAFDAFGNIQSIGGAGARSTSTNSATNRLSGATYDAAGNVTAESGATYEYDPFHQMRRFQSGTEEWLYFYTADDQRIWSYQLGGSDRNRWTLRGLDGLVLREYESDHTGWRVAGDYIYRGSQLLAKDAPGGVTHFHLDHLGTPRLLTDSSGQVRAYHAYYAFGEEATPVGLDAERLKFTGHERDLGSVESGTDDLDYMRARHNSPAMGRFLSVDQHEGVPGLPQSWNRYSYGLGNPQKFTDPNGEIAAVAIAIPVAILATAAVLVTAIALEQSQHNQSSALDLSVLFSKQTGNQVPTDLVGVPPEELLRRLKGATGKAKQDLLRALKATGERNKQKARGGKREPKKPSATKMGALGAFLENPGLDAAVRATEFANALAFALEVYLATSLDDERTAVCGTGVPCFF
jgi:RHS repeat-associated protein